MKYTRTDIIKVLTSAGVECGKARSVTHLIVCSLYEALSSGKTVELRGLGTLEPRERKARIGRNPLTGATVDVSARRVIFFLPGRTLKRALSEARPAQPRPADLPETGNLSEHNVFNKQEEPR